jgi:hypothetical protein
VVVSETRRGSKSPYKDAGVRLTRKVRRVTSFNRAPYYSSNLIRLSSLWLRELLKECSLRAQSGPLKEHLKLRVKWLCSPSRTYT